MSIAIMFADYGPPEVLQPVHVDQPEPAAGQIRVAVRAAGVQPFDCTLRRGDLAQWMPLSLPSCLGNELAGTVEAIGAGVTAVAVGDEILGWQERACYAEEVLVEAEQVVAKPAGMPWEHAGVLSASGQTAHTAIEALGIAAGDTLLIHAAAGGVGSFALQIAVALGATVIGTASPANHDYLRTLGSLPVTYGDGLEDRVRAASAQQVTAVLDCIGGPALEQSLNLVNNPARIVTIADRVNATRLGIGVIGTDRSPHRLSQVVDLYEQDRLQVHIHRAVPLLDAPIAHRQVETGHVRGKVVLIR
ncbi:MAG: NADP-dependent oxidoreductase, partial [Candidatus Dormiibacterota bacterium]